MTGTNPDRLPEEKARGMTIELGFAHVAFDDPASGDQLDLGVVDVPGHADFVKNMVAGVGSIDLALFVIASDDGWMPQTEEHFQILSYLRVPRAVIALTKSDLLEDRDLVIDDIRENLLGSHFEDAPIVPVCALGGEGIDELKSAIADVLRDVPSPPDLGKPRLSIDRVFSPRGIGTVATGTLTGGSFERGSPAVIQPSGLKTHIRNVQCHNTDLKSALPGMRTAVNLSDLSLASREKKEGIRRGDIVTAPNLGTSTITLDVAIERFDRKIPGQPGASRLVKNGQKVRWHHGGASHGARIYFLGQRNFKPGEDSLAELRFSEPVFAFAGDRFVIRDWSKRNTVAGGIILDEDAQRRRFRREAQKSFLEQRAAAPDDLPTWIATAVARDVAVPTDQLLLKSRFGRAEITAAAAALPSVTRVGNWWVMAGWWKNIVADACAEIRKLHERHPEWIGMKLGELRGQIERRLPDKHLFDFLLARIFEEGFIRAPGVIRHRDHQPRLPPDLEAAAARIRGALGAVPLEPPNPKEIAPTSTDEKALQFLIQSGEVIQLDPKAILLAVHFENAKSAVVAYLETKGQATASELRQILGTTRRILVPLLERLDSDGVTLRQGDFRTLKQR